MTEADSQNRPDIPGMAIRIMVILSLIFLLALFTLSLIIFPFDYMLAFRRLTDRGFDASYSALDDFATYRKGNTRTLRLDQIFTGTWDVICHDPPDRARLGKAGIQFTDSPLWYARFAGDPMDNSTFLLIRNQTVVDIIPFLGSDKVPFTFTGRLMTPPWHDLTLSARQNMDCYDRTGTMTISNL